MSNIIPVSTLQLSNHLIRILWGNPFVNIHKVKYDVLNCFFFSFEAPSTIKRFKPQNKSTLEGCLFDAGVINRLTHASVWITISFIIYYVIYQLLSPSGIKNRTSLLLKKRPPTYCLK